MEGLHDSGAFSMDIEKKASLLTWLQTFTVDEEVNSGLPDFVSWQSLSDGIFLARIVHRMYDA
jgi:hypothetical protein